MKFAILLLLFACSLLSIAQIENLEERFALPEQVTESSGLIFFNGKLISHNDSGNENVLFEIDTASGLVSRTVVITNATNTDWEELTQDDTYIYIADIGNNSGDRTDLKIYKITKADYLIADEVSADIIYFSYADQTTFTPNPENTEWDAEALLSFDADNLILFTKNWVNQSTKAYLIPTISGTHVVNPLPSILYDAGLITGATCNGLTGKIYLMGYTTTLQPFVWKIENYTDQDVLSGVATRIFLPELSFEQTEAITSVDANHYFITSESFSVGILADYGKCIAFTTDDYLLSATSSMDQTISVFPNPASDYIQMAPGMASELFTVINAGGTVMCRGIVSEQGSIDIRSLPNGCYILQLNNGCATPFMKK